MANESASLLRLSIYSHCLCRPRQRTRSKSHACDSSVEVEERARNSHPSVSKTAFVVTQHMLAEKHSRGPRLPTTTRSHIFVHLERTGENAIEIDSRNTTGLEGRQWSNVLADGDRVHQRGRRRTAHCERVVAARAFDFSPLAFAEGQEEEKIDCTE